MGVRDGEFLSQTANARAVARLPEGLAKLHGAAMFDWNDLKYFLVFARTGSMLAAAKVLQVNQTTVQRRITELEGRLGQTLVVRHLGGYVLTPRQKNLWATSGSGSLPSAWYSAVSVTWKVRKP